MGVFDRVLRGASRALKKATQAVAPPAKKSGRRSEPAPASSSNAAVDRAALAAQMGRDERERDDGDEEKENWLNALRARADKFAPGLLDELEDALSDLEMDDDILTDTEYETEKGNTP